MKTSKEGYIPRSDADFDGWQNNFILVLVANATLWAILAAEVTAIKAFQTTWIAALAAGNKGLKSVRTSQQTSAKNVARKSYEKALRMFVKRWIIANPAVTEAQRIALRVTVSDSTRTKAKTSIYAPNVEILASKGYTLVFYFLQEPDATGAKKRSIPVGMHGVKIYYMLGENPPKSLEECNKSITITRAQHRLAFDPFDAGKKVFGFACWVNNREEEGAKSSMFAAIVPM